MGFNSGFKELSSDSAVRVIFIQYSVQDYRDISVQGRLISKNIWKMPYTANKILENNVQMEDWNSQVFYSTKGNVIFSSVSYIFRRVKSRWNEISIGEKKIKKNLIGISEVKRLFRRYRFKGQYNIKMYIKELGCKSVSQIRMIQGRIKRQDLFPR